MYAYIDPKNTYDLFLSDVETTRKDITGGLFSEKLPIFKFFFLSESHYEIKRSEKSGRINRSCGEDVRTLRGFHNLRQQSQERLWKLSAGKLLQFISPAPL